MSGYRRFVAYVYEYRKGKKESNCGFIKVEVRDARCTMEVHLQLRGLTPAVECRVYGFVRKDGLMNGLLLGTCETGEDSVECLIETDSMNMGGSGIFLGRMGGMIITTQTGGFFGTEWDDQPIRIDNFREIKAESQPIQAERMEQSQPERTEEMNPEQTEQMEEVIEAEEEPSEALEEPSVEETSVEEASEIREEIREGISEKITEGIAEEAEVQTEEDTVKGEIQPEDNIEAMEKDSDDNRKENPHPVQPLPPEEEFCPFEDCDLEQCWKIHPRDFTRLLRRQSGLRNNRFLQYGYYNFGHILLCRRANGQYILGVPGGYDQQERFMANMFGFPYFRESRLIEIPRGRGGYWYRLIDAPNFN